MKSCTEVKVDFQPTLKLEHNKMYLIMVCFIWCTIDLGFSGQSPEYQAANTEYSCNFHIFFVFFLINTLDMAASDNNPLNIHEPDRFCNKYMNIILRKCVPVTPDDPGSCILWTGSRCRGYGRMSYSFSLDGGVSTKKRYIASHRLLFVCLYKSVCLLDPSYSHIHVSHLCHNPLCCNIKHLTSESREVNEERCACVRRGYCLATHRPHCIIKND